MSIFSYRRIVPDFVGEILLQSSQGVLLLFLRHPAGGSDVEKVQQRRLDRGWWDHGRRPGKQKQKSAWSLTNDKDVFDEC